MKIEHDREHDIAYVNLEASSRASITHKMETPNGGELYLDFDKEGKLVGFEATPASRVLPMEVLAVIVLTAELRGCSCGNTRVSLTPEGWATIGTVRCAKCGDELK